MMPSFSYVRAGTLAEAIVQASEPGARLHAGGTDLHGCLRDGVFQAAKVVSLNGLDELRGIRAAAGGLRIGALVTIAEVAADPQVAKSYRTLSMAAAEVASPQLRNAGTIGGNICQKPRCWYYRGEFHCLRKGGDACYAAQGDNRYHAILGGAGCYFVHPSDPAAALVALGATVRIAGPKGTREVKAADFHVPPAKDPRRETVLDPGEIVTEILLPAPGRNLRSAYRKVRARRAWDFALAGVALALRMDGDRVASASVVLSGVAPVPWRAEAAERALAGRRLDAAAIAAAAEAAVAGAEPMENNVYKVPLVRGVLREQLEAIAG
jgi:xanthine dehydrogenase YagS FAD-binding subunit